MLSREVVLTLGIILSLCGFSAITSVKEQLFQYYILLIYQHCMVNHYPTPMLGYQNLPDISLKRFNLNPMVSLHVHEHLIKYSLESRHNVETSRWQWAAILSISLANHMASAVFWGIEDELLTITTLSVISYLTLYSLCCSW